MQKEKLSGMGLSIIEVLLTMPPQSLGTLADGLGLSLFGFGTSRPIYLHERSVNVCSDNFDYSLPLDFLLKILDVLNGLSDSSSGPTKRFIGSLLSGLCVGDFLSGSNDTRVLVHPTRS